jgi:hypothetical protein
MGYLPQFINGDATAIGKSLVTGTPTAAAAREILGLGASDSPTFNDVFAARFRVPGGAGQGMTGHSGRLRFSGSTVNTITMRLTGPEPGLVVGGILSLSNLGSDTPDIGDVRLYRDAPDILGIRREANPQILNIYKTFTTDTSFERLEIDAAGNVATFDIAACIGSTGGTSRGIRLGRKTAAGVFDPWLSMPASGPVLLSRSLQLPDGVMIGTQGNETLHIGKHGGGGSMALSIDANVTFLRGVAFAAGTALTFSGINAPTTSNFIFGKSGGGHAVYEFNANVSHVIFNNASNVNFHNAGAISMPNLPTSPHSIAGRLWNDGGTLKIS